MNRKDWWLGIGGLVIALLLHAAIPRYEWQRLDETFMVRIDRWTGRAEIGSVFDVRGWTSAAQHQKEKTPDVGAGSRGF